MASAVTSGGLWLLAASGDSRGLERPWAIHKCTREVKNLLREHRGNYLLTWLPEFTFICDTCKISQDNFNNNICKAQILVH